MVVSRIKRRDGQTGLFTGDAFTYRAILTNDVKWDNQQIVSFYNQRGNAERTFDTMNNDFGWSKLPCSFLNENTAFMIITALYANIYQVMLATFARKLSWIKENFRLKKFIFRAFINVDILQMDLDGIDNMCLNDIWLEDLADCSPNV